MSSDFQTTQWSLVLAAGSEDGDRAREALAALCEAYWPPLYAFVRRRGHDPESARDITQAFFAHLLENHALERVERGPGKFRSFLLKSLQNLMADERAKAEALKRGSGRPPFRLDAAETEEGYRFEAVEAKTPESLFEKRWALLVLRRALARLKEEFAHNGDSRQFERLKGFLAGKDPAASYRTIGDELGMSEGATKMAVHRLRKRFGRVLRGEVAATVSAPEDVDGEIRHLLGVLRS